MLPLLEGDTKHSVYELASLSTVMWALSWDLPFFRASSLLELKSMPSTQTQMLPSSCLGEAYQCVGLVGLKCAVYRSWNNWMHSSWVGKLCFIFVEVVDGVLLLTVVVNIPHFPVIDGAGPLTVPSVPSARLSLCLSCSWLSLLLLVVQVEHSRASLSFSQEIQPNSVSLLILFF